MDVYETFCTEFKKYAREIKGVDAPHGLMMCDWIIEYCERGDFNEEIAGCFIKGHFNPVATYAIAKVKGDMSLLAEKLNVTENDLK